MTDAQNSGTPENPVSGAPVPPAYNAPAAPAYGTAPAYNSAPASVPGKTLGIVALVLAFVAAPIGAILGIVALVQSKKAGVKNGLALAAIIIGVIITILGIIALIAFIAGMAALTGEIANNPQLLEQFCSETGPGTWDVGGETITCE